MFVHSLSLSSSQFIACRLPVYATRDEFVNRDGLSEFSDRRSRECDCYSGLETLIPEKRQDRRAYRFLRCSSSLRDADAEWGSETAAASRVENVNRQAAEERPRKPHFVNFHPREKLRHWREWNERPNKLRERARDWRIWNLIQRSGYFAGEDNSEGSAI